MMRIERMGLRLRLLVGPAVAGMLVLAAGGARGGIVPSWVLGWGSASNSAPFFHPPDDLGPILQLDAGDAFWAVVRTDRTIRVWGSPVYDELKLPAGVSGVAKVALGSTYGVILTTNGAVYTWGSNQRGEKWVPAGLRACTDIAAHAIQGNGDRSGHGVGRWVMGSGGAVVRAAAAGRGYSSFSSAAGSLITLRPR